MTPSSSRQISSSISHLGLNGIDDVVLKSHGEGVGEDLITFRIARIIVEAPVSVMCFLKGSCELVGRSEALKRSHTRNNIQKDNHFERSVDPNTGWTGQRSKSTPG
jgi:hypothetical protein